LNSESTAKLATTSAFSHNYKSLDTTQNLITKFGNSAGNTTTLTERIEKLKQRV
jgi:hypothetical protein